jgi:hypothetical protein
MDGLTMSEQQRRVRTLRVKDFVAESLHKIASHSSDGEALHKTVDIVAASTDQAMVAILEDPNAPETEPSVSEKRGIIVLEP